VRKVILDFFSLKFYVVKYLFELKKKMEEISIKCMVVGDNSVEKTTLLIFGCNKSFQDCVPTVSDNYLYKCMWKNQKVNLGLWDTSGQEEYNILRPLSYPDTDVFIVCFSAILPNSFEKAKKKFIPMKFIKKKKKLGALEKLYGFLDSTELVCNSSMCISILSCK
jgi:GTPase SAR1 family protein